MISKYLPKKVLIIDDDEELLETMIDNLASSSYCFTTSLDWLEGLDLALKNKFSLIIVDVNLPHKVGHDIVKVLRLKNISTPIIVITGRMREQNELFTYENHANLFHEKPINYKLLAAQMLLLTKDEFFVESLDVGNIRLDYEKKTLIIDNNEMNLSNREFDLMYVLASDPKKVFNRREILNRIGADWREVEEKTVDNIVYRIRKLLRQDGENDIIETIYGDGFKFKNSNY